MTAITRHLSKKVCLFGDFSVGKTSLVRRFIYDRFDDQYISTIGVKVSRKTVIVPDNEELVELSIMLWDLAGGDREHTALPGYLRGAAGAIVVFDLTRSSTLHSVPEYVKTLHELSPDAQVMLAGNKVDLSEEHEVNTEEVAAMARRFDTSYYLTSAKTGLEVENLFRGLGAQLVAPKAKE